MLERSAKDMRTVLGEQRPSAAVQDTLNMPIGMQAQAVSVRTCFQGLQPAGRIDHGPCSKLVNIEPGFEQQTRMLACICTFKTFQHQALALLRCQRAQTIHLKNLA